MIPRISLVAYGDRPGHFIFVAVPGLRGRYVRTDKSVAHAACRHCGAVQYEPCKSGSGDGYSGTTHFVRRNDVRHAWGIQTDDVLAGFPLVPPPAVPDEHMEPTA